MCYTARKLYLYVRGARISRKDERSQSCIAQSVKLLSDPRQRVNAWSFLRNKLYLPIPRERTVTIFVPDKTHSMHDVVYKNEITLNLASVYTICKSYLETTLVEVQPNFLWIMACIGVDARTIRIYWLE